MRFLTHFVAFSLGTCCRYYYNKYSQEVMHNGDEPLDVDDDDDLNKDVSSAWDELTIEWRSALVGQILGRRFLLNNRVQVRQTTRELQDLVNEVRETRDLDALVDGITLALSRGLSDESELYITAGELWDDLQNERAAELGDDDIDKDREENVMTSFQNSLYVE